jgi:hypothetical protein
MDQFIADGYVAIPGAFSRADAREAQAILWAATGCDPDNPATWTKPVIRLGEFGQPPFARAVENPLLHRAFDQLVGKGRWLPRRSLGTFPVRFPVDADPGDYGWHIDVSFALPSDDAGSFFNWRANWRSRGRALLMLFLFSDVGEDDAPTRIRIGSHRDIARQLRPHGEEGLKLLEIDYAATAHLSEATAAGEAGTVYLCHPFLVHAAQRHRGTRPKFMAQPPLLPRGELNLEPGGEHTPVERAIIAALS